MIMFLINLITTLTNFDFTLILSDQFDLTFGQPDQSGLTFHQIELQKLFYYKQ